MLTQFRKKLILWKAVHIFHVFFASKLTTVAYCKTSEKDVVWDTIKDEASIWRALMKIQSLLKLKQEQYEVDDETWMEEWWNYWCFTNCLKGQNLREINCWQINNSFKKKKHDMKHRYPVWALCYVPCTPSPLPNFLLIFLEKQQNLTQVSRLLFPMWEIQIKL